MSLWDALRMNMMISYQELVRTFLKQVPVEEDAYNTKVITLSRSGSLPEVIETSHDYAKVMDKGAAYRSQSGCHSHQQRW